MISSWLLSSSSLELSDYSLSLSHSLGHLEFSWSTLVWSKGKGRQGKEWKSKQGTRKGMENQARKKERKVGSRSFNRNTCK